MEGMEAELDLSPHKHTYSLNFQLLILTLNNAAICFKPPDMSTASPKDQDAIVAQHCSSAGIHSLALLHYTIKATQKNNPKIPQKC